MDNLLFKSGNAGQVNVDQAQGIVECFVAGIGNKDSVGDIVISGAFAKSLTRRKPRVVWGHSWNDPIGKVLEMYEVPVGDSRLPAKMRNAGIGGLYAKVQFNLNSEKGKEAFATVAFFGEEQEWSIGYKTIDSVFDPNLQANILKEVELYEVSPVLHGANQLTGTISIKGDEKGHMPIIPMHGQGMPMMQGMPRIVVVSASDLNEDESSEGDPFAEGMSQELSQPDKVALEAELADRTGSKIEVMNATENSVVFRRTTSDGQSSMYRLPYHREGNQYMFGKPEAYEAEAPKPQPQPQQNIEQKPGNPVVVPNGGIAYRSDDQQEMVDLFGGDVASPWGKSDISHLIELPEEYMVSAKDFIGPVLRHHKLNGRPSAKGIIVDGLLTANALDALQNAVKALGTTIGQASGNIGQAIGKIRDLAQTFNPYALDGDGDGFVQDGSAFQRPYVPIKKPGFDLPDVRGRKRRGDALLDKPRASANLPKDKNKWTREQRNSALLGGVIEPETREDVAFLANTRPENEGIAKYWDMSVDDLTKEGNRLVNARRQATGSQKEALDEELLKVSHEFQRRASYAETFGQEFVPPAKREAPATMIPEAEKPKVPSDLDADRNEQRRLDEMADAALDRALEGFIEEYGEDGFDDLTSEEQDILLEQGRDQERGLASRTPVSRRRQAINNSLEEYLADDSIEWTDDEKQQDRAVEDFLDDFSREDDLDLFEAAREMQSGDRSQVENEKLAAIESYIENRWADAAEQAAERRMADYYGGEPGFFYGRWRDRIGEEGLASRAERRNAERKRRATGEKLKRQFAGGDTSGVDTSALADFFPEDEYDEYGNLGRSGREYVNAVLTNWAEMSQADRDKAIRDNGTIVEDPDSVAETLRDALSEYGYKNPKIAQFLDEAEAEADMREMYGEEGFAARGRRSRGENTSNDSRFYISGTNRSNDTGFDLDGEDRSNDTGFLIGEFGSNPEDSKMAQAFDAILEKYWKMWGFDTPDENDPAYDEPFGFASRGKDEEVQQSKLDDLVNGVRDRLIAELETADPSTWKPSWRDDSLPINPITGKPYRGWNAFWLMFATHDRKYKTGRYAGFNQLKERGAIVRKGEKGIPILRPQLVRKEDKDGNVKEFLVYRGAHVFNIDQTDGGDEALRAIPADLPESERIKILDDTLAELGVEVRTANTTPHYSPSGDYVSMPEYAKGKSALEWSSTLAHETVHWTGGASRLNRPSVANYSDSKQTRAYEELVAEIGSAMLLAAHGIEAPFRQDHAPYIKGWIELLKDDPTALERAFKDAQASVNYMLEKSPNLRRLFGGLDNGKKAPEVDAPIKVGVAAEATEGFASLHRVRTPGSKALAGVLYDDNSNELMVGFLKGKDWEDLSDGEKARWIGMYIDDNRRPDFPMYPVDQDEMLDARGKELYEDAREIGWYVYSGVSMDEVQELAATKSKGKHINALKKLKKARKASDEDQFNFFGRSERIQDVSRAKSTDGFAARGVPRGNENISVTRDRSGYMVLSAMVTGNAGSRDEDKGTFRLQTTYVGGSQRENMRSFRYAMRERNLSFAGEDGLASRGTKRLGVEPRYQDKEWIEKTQTRILRSNLDFQSLSKDEQIDWVNSFLNEYLNENEMGHNLSDVANGRRMTTRPDIDLWNYAEQAYARMSDAHMRRRAHFGIPEEGFASVGTRTRRLGTQPSDAVDYVAWDPDTDSLFVSYKRGDGRSQMYVYEGVNSDEALDVENAPSLGRAINAIKRSKNVRQATPEEIVGLSDMDKRGLEENKARLSRMILQDLNNRVFGLEGELNTDFEMDVSDSDGNTIRISIDPDTALYTVERYKTVPSLDRDEPSDMRLISRETAESAGDVRAITDRLRKAAAEEGLAESRLDRELEDARRELDEAGDLPGVESIDVTYSSAVDAVDYNPTTRELRVSYRDGGTYIYEDVDRITVDDLKYAPSKGRAMNQIKREHSYRRDSEWTGGTADLEDIEEFDVRGSAAVERVTYDPKKEELTVTYSGGRGYVYSGVTRKEADAVRSAPSKGRAINDIKRSHDVRNVEDGETPKDRVVRMLNEEENLAASFERSGMTTSDAQNAAMFEMVVRHGETAGEALAKLSIDDSRELMRTRESALRKVASAEAVEIDPAPMTKIRVRTEKPPRGGKRVRYRNVVIEMEQGTLDEIMEAEKKGTTVDALRAARGESVFTKGPRKGKRRGPDTITVRDSETGELLHSNEILMTSSAQPGNPSAANRKRGFIRARSYAGRQGHNITKDDGPSLRGEGKGMTEYDKRVYGLGSDEKNREYGLASRSSMDGLSLERTPQDDLESFQNYLDSEYGEYFMDYTQMDDEELKKTLMQRYRMSRSEANATAKQIRKDQDTLDDLYIAADDAGFASRNSRRLARVPSGAMYGEFIGYRDVDENPVVRGEKSPLVQRRSIFDFDGDSIGGILHSLQNEQTYDINGPVSMRVSNPEGVGRTVIADQVVRDWSRSDLTVDEIADRFNMTPLQVQDILEDAAARIQHAEDLRNRKPGDPLPNKKFRGKWATDERHIAIGDEVAGLFEGDRKPSDIPEPTKAVLRGREKRDAKKQAHREWSEASKARSAALEKLRNSKVYRDALAERERTFDTNSNAIASILENDRVNGSGKPFDDQEENLRILQEVLNGDQIAEVLTGTEFEKDFSDYFNVSDYDNSYYDDEGYPIDPSDLDLDWFDVYLDDLTDEERKELADAVGSLRESIANRNEQARKALGLPDGATYADAKKVRDQRIQAAGQKLKDLEAEFARDNPVPPFPTSVISANSSLMGAVDDDTNKFVTVQELLGRDSSRSGLASRGSEDPMDRIRRASARSDYYSLLNFSDEDNTKIRDEYMGTPEYMDSEDARATGMQSLINPAVAKATAARQRVIDELIMRGEITPINPDRSGFASRGRELPDMRPYDELTDREKSNLEEAIRQELTGSDQEWMIYGQLNEGGFDYDEFLSDNPEFHPDFADYGDPGDMGLASRGRSAVLMEVDPKNSRIAKKITYDPQTGELTVVGRDGRTQKFQNVPYEDVRKAGAADAPDGLIKNLRQEMKNTLDWERSKARLKSDPIRFAVENITADRRINTSIDNIDDADENIRIFNDVLNGGELLSVLENTSIEHRDPYYSYDSDENGNLYDRGGQPIELDNLDIDFFEVYTDELTDQEKAELVKAVADLRRQTRRQAERDQKLLGVTDDTDLGEVRSTASRKTDEIWRPIWQMQDDYRPKTSQVDGLASGRETRDQLQERLDDMIRRQEALDTSTREGQLEWLRLEDSIGALDDRILGMGEAEDARSGEGFASMARSADEHWTEFPRGDEGSYRDYLSNIDAEAEAILEDADSRTYKEIRNSLVQNGRLFGGPGDTTQDVSNAFKEEYREAVGLTEDEWNDAPPVMDFGDPGDMGFASRGARKSTDDYAKDVATLKDEASVPSNLTTSDLVDYRQRAIQERNRMAAELMRANGIDPENVGSWLDVTEDDDDIDVLEEYGDLIDELDEDLNRRRKVKERAEAQEQASIRALGGAQDLMKDANRLDIDRPFRGDGTDAFESEDEWIEEQKSRHKYLLDDIQEFVDDESEVGEDEDYNTLASVRHADYLSDDSRRKLDALQEKLDNAKTYEDFQAVGSDLWDIARDLENRLEDKFRDDEAYNDYETDFVPDDSDLIQDYFDGDVARGATAGPLEVGTASTRRGNGFASRGDGMPEGGSTPAEDAVIDASPYEWQYDENEDGSYYWTYSEEAEFEDAIVLDAKITKRPDGKYELDWRTNRISDLDEPTGADMELMDDGKGEYDTLQEAIDALGEPETDSGYDPVGEARADEMYYESIGDTRDGFASRGTSQGRIPVIREEFLDFDDLSTESQDRIIQRGMRDVAIGPNTDMEAERDAIIYDWNDEVRQNRADKASEMLREIQDLMDQGADDDNIFQRNGNLLYAEELIKNIYYVDPLDMDEAQEIIDRVKRNMGDDGDGLGSRGGRGPRRDGGGGMASRGGRTEKIDVSGSRAVEQATYDPEKEELLVVYNGNRGYIYEGVTRSEATDLINAPSKGGAINGIKATHSFRRASDSDVADFDIDPAQMRQAEVDANWERLPSADKEQYLRRATNAGIAGGTGESADELLSAAKLRAMDDREMAMLEREAIGRGESSSRRIDVSSSSALNYADYDEKTRTLSVEFRGRDGKGTGTVYNYQGVEPDVVDELENSDSRGATMRRIRDNYEFTTSERLPESAYEGLASQGKKKPSVKKPKSYDKYSMSAYGDKDNELIDAELEKLPELAEMRRLQRISNEEYLKNGESSPEARQAVFDAMEPWLQKRKEVIDGLVADGRVTPGSIADPSQRIGGDEEGLASRGRRGKRRAPKQSWSAEDRQNFADRNFVRSRTRPGKRRGGPDAQEWNGLASTSTIDEDMIPDVPLDPRGVFEGGEHGPGKDISLQVMWENYNRLTGGKRNDRWLRMERNGAAGAEEVAEFFDLRLPNGKLDLQLASQILKARTSSGPELFIDDPYLADRLAVSLGFGPGTSSRLFGFDPLAYVNEAGEVASEVDEIDRAIQTDRARRLARQAARARQRVGKDTLVARGDVVTVADLEESLQRTNPSIKLTNDDGSPLSPERMRRAIINADIDIPWSATPYRQIVNNGGILTPTQVADLINLGLLDSGRAPARGDLAISEALQWPEFSKFKVPQILTAMADVLGLDRAELDKISRTVGENLTYGRQGKRVPRSLRSLSKAGIKMSRQQIAEMAERLGLDAAEFDKWFDTAPFTE